MEQVYGTGGLYNITLKIYFYYRAHITYGEDLVVVNSEGELPSYKHMKTYPKETFISKLIRKSVSQSTSHLET
ncbi:DUF3888 domain-containing protein [Cytobacillus kochii]|uniref:DUF3888 domain-containing protein n=1 Tax=Cytobacillus kochii TaxID=859143 RepID=UPI002E1AEA1D|nr:DUF3888 domain-containing protein [Cytobacillus kochii]